MSGDVNPTTERCTACDGRGELFDTSMSVLGIPGGEVAYALCPACAGAGQLRPAELHVQRGTWWMKAVAMVVGAMLVLLGIGVGRASAQEATCTTWVPPVPGPTFSAPSDADWYDITLTDGTTVRVEGVVLGQEITVAGDVASVSKCVGALPEPTPEPTPDPTPTPEPEPIVPPAYVTRCGLAEITDPGVGWVVVSPLVTTPLVAGHVVSDGDVLTHESGQTVTVVAPTEDDCTEVVVPSPTPTVIIPPPPTPETPERPTPPNVPASPVPAGTPCGPPPTDQYEEPTCLPETGADLEARWGLLLIASGASLLFGSWVLNADRRAVRRYRKAGR